MKKSLTAGIAITCLLGMICGKSAMAQTPKRKQKGKTTSSDPAALTEDEKSAISRQMGPGETINWNAGFVAFFSARKKIQYRIEKDPANANQVLADILADLKASSEKPSDFNYQRTLFSEAMLALENNKIAIPPDRAAPISDGLIELYLGGAKKYPDRGQLVVDFVARYGGSAKSKQFILDVLRNPGAEYKSIREQGIIALCYTQVFKRDSDVYDALIQVYGNDKKNYNALAAISRIDPDKAKALLQREVNGTRDIYRLNKIAGIVSQMHRPELVDMILMRAEQVPATGRGFDHDPTAAIYDSALKEHLRWAEDDSLARGLKLLDRVWPDEALPILQDKLKSTNPASRRLAITAIGALIKGHKIRDTIGREIIERHAADEADLATKRVAVTLPPKTGPAKC